MGLFKKIFHVDPEIYFQKGVNAEFRDGNRKKAAIYYEMASNDGHAEAKYHLAMLYASLGPGYKEYELVYTLIKEAADLGHKQSIDFKSQLDKDSNK